MGTHGGTISQRKASYSQYVSVRQRLDDLGYTGVLSNDSVPLVEKLLEDLVRYKEQADRSRTKKVSQISHCW